MTANPQTRLSVCKTGRAKGIFCKENLNHYKYNVVFIRPLSLLAQNMLGMAPEHTCFLIPHYGWYTHNTHNTRIYLTASFDLFVYAVGVITFSVFVFAQILLCSFVWG